MRPAPRLLLAAACLASGAAQRNSCAAGATSLPDAPDSTLFIQVHTSADVKGLEERPKPSDAGNLGSAAELAETHQHGELEARADHAVDGLWFGPEPAGDFVIGNVEKDIDSSARTDISEGTEALNQALTRKRGLGIPGSSLMDRWANRGRLAKDIQGGVSQQSSAQHWLIRADGNETLAPGTILHFAPGDSGSVSLRTEFGKWLVVKEGRLTADTAAGVQGETGSSFFFRDHPFRRRDEGRVVSWSTSYGSFIGVGADGSLVEMVPTPGDQRTKFRLALMGDDQLVLQSARGLVLAMKDEDAVQLWEARLRAESPFRTHLFGLEAGAFLKRFGWDRGWIVGIIVGGFIMLTIHNVACVSTDAKAGIGGRLAGFDVARFLLEYLVIYSHFASMLGLVDWGISHWLTAYKMPAFAFIAGVFGSSMAYESVTKMLCYTIGTIAALIVLRLVELQAIWGSYELSKQVGSQFTISDFAPGIWFLTSLFVWRVTISPIFFAVRRLEKAKVAVAVAFVIVWVASFLLMGWTKRTAVWLIGSYSWQRLLFFAPFFAAGLLKRPEEWDALFKRRYFRALCAAFFLAFHVLTAISGFKRWNRSASCLPADAASCYAHLYPQAMYAGIGAGPFFYDLLFFVLRLGLAVSTVCLLCAATALAEGLLPRATALAAGWGSRTLYAYTIHVHLFNMLDKDGYVADITSRWADHSKFVVALLLAAVVNVSLSSQGCEQWFHWLLRPYWIKDLLEWAIRGCPARAPKSKGVDEAKAIGGVLEQDPAGQPGKQPVH